MWELLNLTLTVTEEINIKQEAFEKSWAHSPLRAAARRLLILHCHSPGVVHHYQDEPKPAIAIAQAACDNSDTW